MKIFTARIFILLFVFTVACASRPPKGINIFQNEFDGIVLRVLVVKNKNKSIDVVAEVHNKYKTDISMKEDSIFITYQGEKFQMTPDKGYFHVDSGDKETMEMVFKMKEDQHRPPGEFTLEIGIVIDEKTQKPLRRLFTKLPLGKDKLDWREFGERPSFMGIIF